MDILGSDASKPGFVLLGRRKLRLTDISSVTHYPKTASSDERIVVEVVHRDAAIVIPSGEPHFEAAVAFYRAIDAVDPMSSPSPGPTVPWTPSRVVSLFEGYVPDACGVTVSLMLVDGANPSIAVIAAAKDALGTHRVDETICCCNGCLARTDYPSKVEGIKRRIAASFAAAPSHAPTPSAN